MKNSIQDSGEAATAQERLQTETCLERVTHCETGGPPIHSQAIRGRPDAGVVHVCDGVRTRGRVVHFSA